MFRRLGLILTTALAALTTVVPASASAPVFAPVSAPRPTVTVVAHRGASAYAPENTVAAFELARDQRADMFELDVQETRDHELVVVHDTTLARTTDAERVFPGRAPWRVGDLTLAEIGKLDAGSWFAAKYRGEPVPTLGEALRAMDDSELGLLLEVKAPELYKGIEARIADELRRNPSWLKPGRLVVQSFGWDSMRTFHRTLPQVPIGLLGTPRTGDLAELATFAAQINPPYGPLTADYVRLVHDHRMDVLAWTADDPRAMRRLITAGVDGVITNKPDVLRGLTGSPNRLAPRCVSCRAHGPR